MYTFPSRLDYIFFHCNFDEVMPYYDIKHDHPVHSIMLKTSTIDRNARWMGLTGQKHYTSATVGLYTLDAGEKLYLSQILQTK